MKKNVDQKNWLEWSVTIISGIIVTFTLGFLIVQMVYEEQTPPDIEVVLGEVSKKDGAYAIPISAYNHGTETAENVIVEVTFEKAGNEKSQITFQYLPKKSMVKGWLTFSEHPEPNDLKSRIIGYSTP